MWHFGLAEKFTFSCWFYFLDSLRKTNNPVLSVLFTKLWFSDLGSFWKLKIPDQIKCSIPFIWILNMRHIFKYLMKNTMAWLYILGISRHLVPFWTTTQWYLHHPSVTESSKALPSFVNFCRNKWSLFHKWKFRTCIFH